MHIKDATGHAFATRFIKSIFYNLSLKHSLNNVFIIGKGGQPLISLPADKGIKLSIAEERDKRLAQKQKAANWIYLNKSWKKKPEFNTLLLIRSR